jgi:UPF0288 family protein (methanogenesis marker protein 3)
MWFKILTISSASVTNAIILPKDCSITLEFLKAYIKSNVKGAVKSLVLRVLLGDPSLFPEQAASPAGVKYFRRVTQFFEYHPKQHL